MNLYDWFFDAEYPEDDDTSFPCPCGDPACVGDNTDAHNIKLGATWYAADCKMANSHPEVVADRAREQERAERRDDFFEQVRR